MKFSASLLQAGLAILLSVEAAHATAGEVYSPMGLHCPAPEKSEYEDTTKVSSSLRLRYAKVWGKDWLGKPKPQQRIDPVTMGEIAAISGCAAIMDLPACATFFDPEMGGDLSMFANFSTKVPVRKQFDEAVVALPSVEAKKAVQACMKLVAKK
jgi:hypothetical protein